MRALTHIGPGTPLTGSARYTLGTRIGGGGEGAIYRIRENAGLAAKIYFQAPPEATLRKLVKLLAMRKQIVTNHTAWPLELLREVWGAAPVGFLMPLVADAQPLHMMINPADRRRSSPDAGFAVLVDIAVNIARMVQSVHANDVVIGDLSAANILLRPDTTVCLIDCNSLQVGTKADNLRCLVGLDDMIPPELQGRKLAEVHRTPNHDAFPLAVLLFQLLCFGRHPHAAAGDAGIGRAIADKQHALSLWHRTQPLAAFGITPRHVMSSAMRSLFRRAFDRSHLLSRPAAADWHVALQAFRRTLVQCSQNPAHQFRPGRFLCPWCAVERKSGLSLFRPTPLARRRSLIGEGAGALWSRLNLHTQH